MKVNARILLRCSVLILLLGLVGLTNSSLIARSASLPKRLDLQSVSQAPETLSPFGYGVNDGVSEIKTSGAFLYIAGSFTQMCGNPNCDNGNIIVNRIAKWNGSAWSSLGYGLNDWVGALWIDGNTVYAGGTFTQICGNPECNNGNVTARGVAKWNGVTWEPIGFGLTGGGVYSLAEYNGELYAGGSIYGICIDSVCSDVKYAHNIARWNGVTWVQVAYGFGNFISTLVEHDGLMYIGGSLSTICGSRSCRHNNIPVNGLATWNGSELAPVTFGVLGYVNSLVFDGDTLYVGGNFYQVCSAPDCQTNNKWVRNIALWDKSKWLPLGYGVYGAVSQIDFRDDDLYVIGGYRACKDDLCDISWVNRADILIWDDSQWSALGNGLDSDPVSFGFLGKDMYFGGNFEIICGNPACDNGNQPVRGLAKFSFDSCEAIPGKPALLSPANGASLVKARPTLKWSADSCADTFTVTVKDAATNKKVEVAAGLTSRQYKLKDYLPNGKTYKWFVKSCNTFGCAKSAKRTFTVQ